nr:peptidylprolyl isomerase [Clostridia bacterium]
MKMMKKMLSLLLALLMLMGFAAAETDDMVVAVVNGQEIMYSDYYAVECAYIDQYQQIGVDTSDTTIYAYLQNMALTYVIEQVLVLQDMTAQGCFNFTEEEEAWCAEQGKLAWEQALAEVGEMMRETLELSVDEDMGPYALSYADSLGVTEQTYVEEYRTQLAMSYYYAMLVGENAVTEEDVLLAYVDRVSESQTLYANDVVAFENAVYNGQEVWYMPEGYRAVLQILLPAEGETNAERLASAQNTIDEIYARLENGEAFTDLIVEYGIDSNFDDESFFQTGYQVHRESVVWEDAFVAAAFSEEMAVPGDWSQPFTSDLGVHILYYLGDVPGGEAVLSDALTEALAYTLYLEKAEAALAERIDVLADAADVVIY